MGEDPGGGPRRWPWVVALCLIVASAAGAVLVAAAQSDSDEVRADPSDQASDDAPTDLAVRSANDPIVGGFVVAEGTTVPGGAFPGRGGTYDGEPMEAWSFLVTAEDLPAAVDAYVAQARSLGFAGPGTAGQFCDVQPPSGTVGPDGAEITAPTDAPPSSLVCGAYGQRLVDGRAEVVQITAERSYDDESPIDEMAVTFVRYPPEVGLPFPQETDAAETTVDTGGAYGTPWSEWTGAGPTVSTLPPTGPSEDCGPPIAAPEGVRLIGAAYACGLHYALVYDVSSDPDAFEQFTEQIRTSKGFNEWTYESTDVELEDRQGRLGSVSSDDSTSLTVTMMEEHVGRPAVLRVDYVNGT